MKISSYVSFTFNLSSEDDTSRSQFVRSYPVISLRGKQTHRRYVSKRNGKRSVERKRDKGIRGCFHACSSAGDERHASPISS